LWQRRIEGHETAFGQGQQHAVECLLAGLDACFVHEPFAQDGTHPRHFRRQLQQVGEQPPRHRSLAEQFAGRRGLQLLKLGLAPIDGILTARGFLLFESFFGF
jgi:hypothetical protein